MIGSTRNVHVYACGAPVSMRNGVEGLAAIARHDLRRDPMNGDLYLFVGIDRRRAKVLYFDGTGMCLFYKRLEKGRFASVWSDGTRGQIKLTMTELTLFLEGSQLVGRFPVSPAAIGENELAIAFRP